MKYALLLRGINVGGNKKVPMATLKRSLTSLGLEKVKTLLNTGNVVCKTSKTDEATLRQDIEKTLEKTFGFAIPSLVFPFDTLEKMVAADPFKNITVTKDTRLYVTFTAEKPTNSLTLPHVSEDKQFTILKIVDRAIFSVLTLSSGSRSVDAMGIIEKTYGSNVTTRNWNTVKKLAAL